MTSLVARALGLTPQQLLDRFIPATAEHLAGVVALRRTLNAAALYKDDSAYLSWRYRFGSQERGRGDCWVLVLDGSVCGMVGTEEVELQRDDKRIAAWSTMDIAVDRRFEGSGLGSWMNQRLCQAAGCALTIGSNDKSRNMITRTFRRLPDRRSYVHPIRFERILGKRIGVPIAAHVATWLADAAWTLYRKLVFRGTRRTFEFRSITRFDSTAADLLRRAMEPNEWCIPRSIEFLNWRLFGNSRVRYTVTGAYDQGVLAGFMATMARSNQEGPDSVALVEWQVDRALFPSVFTALCGHVVMQAVDAGAESVAVTAYHERSERLLRRFGFVQRLDGFETVAVYATDEQLLPELLAPAPWFLTEANTDRDNL